ncbi:hypothetical protein MHYP_G00103490, partial [Metynnis hypsauchen]
MDEAGMTLRILLITLFLISVGGGESVRVTGYSGGGVLIKCRYETQYTTNWKYFCKSPWSDCADQIMTGVQNKWINSGRFSLFDDTRASQVWVLITELTLEDSGTYYCGVDKDLNFDVYTPVELKVEEDQNYEKSISVAGYVEGGVNISCKYPQSHKNDPKFLCKRVGTADCDYETWVQDSKICINEGKLYLYYDGKQIFTVIINSLTEGDSGEYWCGAESDRTSDPGYNVYITQINLRVTEPPTTPSSSTSRSSSTPQSTKTASSTSTSTMRLSFESSTAADILPQTGSPTTRTTASSTFAATLSQLSETAFPVSSVVTGVSVILLLLLIGLLFLIVTLRKRNKTRGTDQSQLLKGSPD